MNDTLKVAGRIGADLGAAKAENERLRGLLREATQEIEDWGAYASEYFQERHDLPGTLARFRSALSQQAEPTDTYTAVEMATAAAQGFRDGQAAVELAQAQDEREARDWEMKARGVESVIHYVVSKHDQDVLRLHADDMRAEGLRRATRPAQTERQPVAVQPDCDAVAVCGCRIVQSRKLGNVIILCASHIAQTEQQPIGWITEDYLTDKSATTYSAEVAERWRAKGWPVSEIYAAPIAQTAPQPEQSGLASEEWIEHGPSKPCPFHNPYLSKVDIRLRGGAEMLGELACNHTWFWYEHSQAVYDIVAYRPALSAQGGSDE